MKAPNQIGGTRDMNKIEMEFPDLFANDGSWTCFDFSIGPGWERLVIDLCKDIRKTGVGTKVVQVKEKFGALRFYVTGGNNEVFDLIEAAENKSTDICEECGEPGTLASIRGWLTTRCKKHRT